MTPDERTVLQQFLSDLGQARGADKDPEADAMISQVVRGNPEAPYLLVQHAILADQALQAAQVRIQQIEQQLGGGGQTSGGFFGSPAAPSAMPAPPAQPEPKSPLANNSGLSSFMRTAGVMAAGVAGGEFLAQGLSNLFSPHDW
jgi:uncharacterized protein